MNTNNNLIFGYDLSDYKDIFALTDDELSEKILEIPDHYSSFAIECNTRGGLVRSFNELFTLSNHNISNLLKERINNSEKEVSLALENSIYNQEKLLEKNNNILEQFLLTYDKLHDEQIYVGGNITSLPFEDLQFDLALCCRNLFGMSLESSVTRDIQVISELLRVASRIKIFPLNDLQSNPCEYIGNVMMHFQKLGFRIEVVNVNDRLMGSNNATLCLWNTECKL